MTTLPLFSQLVSMKYAVEGEVDTAKAIQKEYFHQVSRTIDYIPLIGLVKGLTHFALKDPEGGNHAIIATIKGSLIAAGAVFGLPVGMLGILTGAVAGCAVGSVLSSSPTEPIDDIRVELAQNENGENGENTGKSIQHSLATQDVQLFALQNPVMSLSSSDQPERSSQLDTTSPIRNRKSAPVSDRLIMLAGLGFVSILTIASVVLAAISINRLSESNQLLIQRMNPSVAHDSKKSSSDSSSTSKTIKGFVQNAAHTAVGMLYDRVF